MLAGVAVIQLEGDFTRDTTFQRVRHRHPHGRRAAPLRELSATAGSRYGLGVYVPYGLTSQWKDDFPGRFAAQKASLQTIYVQPNVAFQITERLVGRSADR